MTHQPSQNGPAVPPTLPLATGQYSNNSSASSHSHSSHSPSPSHGTTAASNGSSYIVLGSHSSGGRSPNEFSMVSGNNSLISLTDITLEQALAKVQELATENTSLREYLKENNDNMKKQYQMLLVWKEKVRESNQMNLHKFEEFKAKLHHLDTENRRLKQHISASVSGKEQVAMEFPSSSSNVSKGSLVNELQERIERLMQEMTDKENKVSKLTKKVKDLEEQVQSPLSDKDTVFVSTFDGEDEIEKLQKYNSDLERRYSELEVKVQNFHQQNEQLMADMQEVQKLKQTLQEENSNLIQENVEAQKRMQSFLGDIKQTKHSIGTGATLENYGYNMGTQKLVGKNGEETETQESVAEQQDIQILELQSSAAGGHTAQTEEQKLEEFNMSEITSDLRDKLDEERNITSKQKQRICDKEAKIAELETKLKEKEHMLCHYKEQVENQVAAVTQEHQQQQQVLLRQLGGLNTELYQAKSSMAQGQGADVQSLKSQVLTLIKEIQESSAKLEHLSRALEKKSTQVIELEQYNHRLSEELQKQRLEGDALITSLRSSLGTYEDTLMKERGDHMTTKRQLNELRASFNRLVTDYKELLDTFDTFKVQQHQQMHDQQSHQVPKNAMDQINQLTAQTIAAEEAITFRDEEIKKLKVENKKMKDELDNTVPILQAQAEVWRQDFDAEREARERQHMEKENILQEMKNLEIRNQQLLDEIENQSRRSLAEMQRRHAPNTYQQQMQQHLQVGSQSGYHPYPGQQQDKQNHQQQQDMMQRQQNQMAVSPGDSGNGPEIEEQLKCPKCGEVCPDLDTLQIHVIDCIDN